MKSSRTALWGVMGGVLLLAACGGGGGGAGAAPQDVGSGAQVQAVATSTGTGAAPAEAAPGTSSPAATPTPDQPANQAPATRPDVMVASMDDIAAWNAACTTDECRITLPPRSGRSLNWWGTDPRLMEQVNESCGPQPDCRVPDGDLLVWNFDCSPQPTCRIRLSRAY